MFSTKNLFTKLSLVTRSTQQLIGRTQIRTNTTTTTTDKKKLWKITLMRSTIGLPPKTRKNVKALGLYSRGMVIYRPICNELAGIILKIKELVKLELVDERLPIKNPAPKGYEVIRKHNSLASSTATTKAQQ
ncbi:39S ribosomal protein L33, mitochondrial [Mycoemilia scoparia]|uniref:Large ribosomal subunit protein uL30m n=1 Tax=Mycoemilia scoparia TaxID=417184 RepID=A0A9W8A1C1_9FUNG|nr:39S ribosomal protein L33, mitochondrial [Mycoemilia scoparia]